MNAKPRSFTGRARQRKTSKLVRFGDIAARTLITIGGIGTILAVLTVMVFLLWVTFPLFLPAKAGESQAIPVQWDQDHPISIAADEYQLLAYALMPDGSLNVMRMNDGQVIETRKLFDDTKVTASYFGMGDEVAFGFDNGTVRIGRLGFSIEFVDVNSLDEKYQSLKVGETALMTRNDKPGLLQRSGPSQYRYVAVRVDLDEPTQVGQSPIALLAQAGGTDRTSLAVMSADGKITLENISERVNLLTRKVTRQVEEGPVPYEVGAAGGKPRYMLLSGLGDTLYLIWADGLLQRYDARNIDEIALVETRALVEPGNTITACRFLLGQGTILVGDSAGRVGAWFATKPEKADSADGIVTVRGHLVEGPAAAVTALATSQRSRVAAIGYANGESRLFQITSQKLLVKLEAERPSEVFALAVSPKEDGLVAATKDGLYQWDIEPRHPEATVPALFRPVWYEGAQSPGHVWQSSSGTDDFEPKLGLMPLVFGTIKATVYSLVFGVPIAILAAIYTSEFLRPDLRARIKPTVELMASLPSVVLGFIAALVLAPIVEQIVPGLLSSFFTVPLAFLVGAYLWQLLPQNLALRLSQWRFFFICLATPLGLVAAWIAGPIVEYLLFAGDIKLWLDGQIGSGIGAWLILLLPLSAIAAAIVVSRLVNPVMQRISTNWSRTRFALASIGKFLVACAATLAIALAASGLLVLMGWDPRGTYVDTYEQRNALVVGFVMGFAIIPIIYTIAEDALSTVPEHLRAASLGAGATPWQTATRIIIPTAMSGLFSAVMIGLGRAVGETMIVLMAAGNTPVMEWNIFNGFRTLSANIAVELPEAVRNSTHYRTLFLAALVLFAITFVLNTVAETIRLRFRKRAYQL